MRRTLAGALCGLTLLAGCTGDPEPASSGQPTPSASTPGTAPTGEPTATVPAGGRVTELQDGAVGLAPVGTGFWATLPEAGTVLDAHGGQTRVGSFPLRLVETPAGVWVSVIGDGRLVRLSQGDGDVDLRVALRPPNSEPEGLAYDGRSLWVVDQAGDRVLEVDPATGSVRDEYPTGHEPRLVTSGPSGVFVGDYTGGSVTRVADGEARTRNAGSCLSPQGLVEAAGVLWVACTVDGQVVGLDPQTLSPVVELPDLPHADAVVADGDTVYVVGQEGPTVWTLDARAREVVGELVLDSAPPTQENVGAALVRGLLVVSHPETRRLYEVPLRLLGR